MELDDLKSSDWSNPDVLVELLRKWSHAYYNIGTPPVDDAIYDSVRNRLQQIEPGHPHLAEVGSPVIENPRQHRIPMGSLNNLHNIEELKTWWHKIQPESAVVQYKYDGASVSLEYCDGTLQRVLTRGDGITGQDITDNMRNSYDNKSIMSLPIKFSGSVRGEILIFKDDWAKHFPGESNPRNTTAGTIRRENSDGAQWVRIFVYDLINGITFETELEKLEYIAKLGLPTTYYKVVYSPEQVIEEYESVRTRRENLDFMIDGLVIKDNNISHQEKLGENHGRPKWAMALKFPYVAAETTITDIKCTIGHTGAIIPTAEYEPTVIDGRTFTHALLDNFNFIEKQNINIGDKVNIEIAGDIIPRITCVTQKCSNTHFPRPTTCPVCNNPTQVTGAATKCTNDLCPAKTIAQLKNWVKKTGIKHFGPSRQKACYEQGIIQDPADLYSGPGAQEATLGAIIGHQNARIVRKEVESHRTLDLATFMGSLGIPFLGRSNAQKMIKNGIDTLDKFLTLDPSTRIPGFAENMNAIVDGIRDSKTLIQKLIDANVHIIEETDTNPSEELANNNAPTFCFTGFRLHGETKAAFEGKGFAENSKVSKDTDYLVAKDVNKNSSKIQKARSYGVQIIDIETLESWLQ